MPRISQSSWSSSSSRSGSNSTRTVAARANLKARILLKADKGEHGEAEARLIALACSEPPEGYAGWTIRLLAEKVVELNIVETVHFNTVGRVLKKTNLSLTAASTG